jgi:hypothetical protein
VCEAIERYADPFDKLRANGFDKGRWFDKGRSG